MDEQNQPAGRQDNQNQPQSESSAKSQPQETVTQPLSSKTSSGKLAKLLPFLLVIIVVALGIGTGLVLASANRAKSTEVKTITEEELPAEIKENFAQTFSDEAEGTVEKNDDLDKYAQGTHKLIRPGGETQTAYLTSTTLDLDEYVGKKVKVYGETFGSSQVGWLMDVGKIEEVN